MDGCTDHDVRQRVTELEVAFQQHATDWWGPDKQNGKRSELVSTQARLGKLESDWTHFQDTRETSCLGLKAFNGYLDTHAKEASEVLIEREKGKQLMTVQWIQVLGLVIVALITLLK